MLKSWTRFASLLAVIAILTAACGNDTSESEGASGEGSESADGTISDSTSETEDTWYPLQVTVWPSTGFDDPSTEEEYVPLAEVGGAWRVCASFPHLQDAYWLAANYGIIDQARSVNVDVTIVEAGSYGNLDRQIQQIEDCAVNHDAIIIGAISYEGLNRTIANLDADGKVVVDFINGVSAPEVTAQSLISYHEIAAATANYLIEVTDGEPVKVAWFPGPQGAGFAEEANNGFQEALEGSNVEIVNVQWGDTGREVQASLVEDALVADPDLDFIVGNAVTAEAAGPIVRDRGLGDQVGVMSYYMTPGTYEGIRNGTVQASAADPAVLTSRIALDLALRALEGEDFPVHVAPPLMVIDADNIDEWDSSTTLAPDSWSPVFTHNSDR